MGSAHRVDSEWDRLLDIAEHVAFALASLEEARRLRADRDGAEQLAAVARDLLLSRQPAQAATATARFLHERTGAPTAAWAPDAERADGPPDTASLVLAGAFGLSVTDRDQLIDRTRRIPHRAGGFASAEGPVEAFREAVGAGGVSAVDAPDALILVAADRPEVKSLTDSIGRLLNAALQHMATRRQLDSMRDAVGLGLAISAHEIRSPLLGARAVIETYVADLDAGRTGDAARLRRSVEELGQLSALVEQLLIWATGAASPAPRATEIAALVRTAVASSDAERVRVLAPEEAWCVIDPTPVRVAVTNLVRNALDYSPPPQPVIVRIEQDAAEIRIEVLDSGPGLGPKDTGEIFDPFIRGSHAAEGRGWGLGLYVARRAVEGEGGTITLGEGPSAGAVFVLHLPRTGPGQPPAGPAGAPAPPGGTTATAR